MDRLSSHTYRQDLDRVASLNLDWDLLRDSTVILSGASGAIGTFLVDVLMARNNQYGMNCTVHALARTLPSLLQQFSQYDGYPNLTMSAVDLGDGMVTSQSPASDNVPLPSEPADLAQMEPLPPPGKPAPTPTPSAYFAPASPPPTAPIRSLPIASADYVIHAASNTHPVAYASDPVGTIMVNVEGTRTMLELALRTHARRTLFLSTVEIYGENRGDVDRFRESDLGYIDSNTLRAGYPESKRTGEALCQAYREQYGADVVIVRLPRVFGPTVRADDTKAMSQFLTNAVAGRDVVLKSAGEQFYSYCHVADAVSGILTCLMAGTSGEAYNVAHPSCDIHLKDLARLVAHTVGQQVVFDLPGAVESRGFSTASLAVMDGSKLAGLGWQPLYTISDGVERTMTVLKETRT
ncbi:MAG: NAD-dependent epimerase/dehydratase family protein [Propionibacteriaceae bacterium]|nr:NAD-dependent epimerase/dehydratase family protein [Propionibacteriaceae bacterium]